LLRYGIVLDFDGSNSGITGKQPWMLGQIIPVIVYT